MDASDIQATIVSRYMADLGRRRQASMTQDQRRELASKAGKASVAALTSEQRKARSKAAAAAREAKRKAV